MKSKKTVNQGHYGQFRGLFKLALVLQNRSGLDLQQIQEELGCSLRTAQRALVALGDIFGNNLEPIENVVPKRWRIHSSQLVDLAKFNADDMLLIGQSAILMREKNRYTDADRLELLNEKLFTASKKNYCSVGADLDALIIAEGFACRPGPRVKTDAGVIENIRTGIKGGTKIKVEYFNKRSGKTNLNLLEPYAILYADRTQYLLARHADGYFEDEIHQFLLSNIKSVTVTNDFFDPMPFDIKNYVKDSFGIYREKPFAVEWKFSQKAANEAEKYEFHPTQTMKRNEDGTLTVQFRAGGTLEMAWHLYTWGKEVEVVKPKNFWQRVQKAEAERWG